MKAKKVITGLHAQININCATEEELLAHLSVIRVNIKRQIRKTPEITDVVTLLDNNYYGTHVVKIKPIYG